MTIVLPKCEIRSILFDLSLFHVILVSSYALIFWQLSLTTFLIALSRFLSNPIHVVRHLLKKMIHHCLFELQNSIPYMAFSLYPLVNGHSSTVVNNGCISNFMFIEVLLTSSHECLQLFGYMPKSGIAGSQGICILLSFKNSALFPIETTGTSFSSQQSVRIPCVPYPCQHLSFSVLLMKAICTGLR